MGAEGAANIVMKNNTDKDATAAKVAEYKANIGGLISARLAHIDDLIDPRETRAVLLRGLQFTFNKRPPRARRKHGVVPV